MILKIGDRQQIFMSGTEFDAVIKDISRVDSENAKGYLVFYDIDGLGEIQPFWIPDDGVTTTLCDTRLGRSGIPGKYILNNPTHFFEAYSEDIEPQKKIANAFVRNFGLFQKEGRGLYIFSKTKGSGKTMLACLLEIEIIKRYGLNCKYITAVDYTELSKGDEMKNQNRKLAKECDLLILDDIGSTPVKDWTTEALFSLIDYRQANMLPTIYTSNVEIDNLKMDDRVTSRIHELSVPLILPEQNIRREKAERFNRAFLGRVLDNEGDEQEVFVSEGGENVKN